MSDWTCGHPSIGHNDGPCCSVCELGAQVASLRDTLDHAARELPVEKGDAYQTVLADTAAAAAAYRDRVRLEGYNEAVAVMLKERERWASDLSLVNYGEGEPPPKHDQKSFEAGVGAERQWWLDRLASLKASGYSNEVAAIASALQLVIERQ